MLPDMLPDMGQSLPAAPVNLDFEAELPLRGRSDIMAEKLFGFGLGYLIRLVRGDLSFMLFIAAGAMMMLAAAVEVWGKRRYQAGYRRNEGPSPA
jgi:hypothetical protein